MMPINLVLVRHGQSEGNKAKRMSEAGDNSAFTEGFKKRHSSSFRLTDLGKRQASVIGQWLRAEFYGTFGWPHCFDRYYVSEYVRAIETAGLMDLPDAHWKKDFYLTERNWGDLDICPEEEREEKFGEALRRREVQPFFWKPPNGESFVELCLRVDRVLHTLHRECSDQNVIAVCHGEVMRAFQVRLERTSQERFKELTFSKEKWDRIYNCQAIHYTRREPITGKLENHANWVRSVRIAPNGGERSTGWQFINRVTYTNDELLATAALEPAMLV